VAGGDEQGDVGGVVQDVGEELFFAGEVFKAVQDEQEFFVLQVVEQLLARGLFAGGDGEQGVEGGEEEWGLDGGEGGEGDAVLVVAGEWGGEGAGEAGFADAAGTEEGDEAGGWVIE
jgi:hypothetical protein